MVPVRPLVAAVNEVSGQDDEVDRGCRRNAPLEPPPILQTRLGIADQGTAPLTGRRTISRPCQGPFPAVSHRRGHMASRVSGSSPPTTTRWRRTTGSLSTFGTSTRDRVPPRCGQHRRAAPHPAAVARTIRTAEETTSGDVRHVQTSSRPVSAPKLIATWSGCGAEATCVFQTRPVASSVACRSAWAGWSMTEPTSSSEALERQAGDSKAALGLGPATTSRTESRWPSSSVTTGCSASSARLAAFERTDEDDVVGQQRAVQAVDPEADRAAVEGPAIELPAQVGIRQREVRLAEAASAASQNGADSIGAATSTTTAGPPGTAGAPRRRRRSDRCVAAAGSGASRRDRGRSRGWELYALRQAAAGQASPRSAKSSREESTRRPVVATTSRTDNVRRHPVRSPA